MPNDQTWTNGGTRANPTRSLSVAFRAASGGGAGTISIAGSGFGLPPNVVIYRSGMGTAGQLAAATAPAGEVGDFTAGANGAPMHAEYLPGEIGFGLHDRTGSGNLQFYFTVPSHRRFRTSYVCAVPDGAVFPGNNVGNPLSHGQFPADSGCKIEWNHYDSESGTPNDEADLCVPTHIGSGVFRIAGNSTATNNSLAADGPNHFAFGADGGNTYDYWQNCDAVDSVNNNSSQRFRWTSSKINGVKTTGTKTWDTYYPSFGHHTGSPNTATHGNGDSYSVIKYGALNRELTVDLTATQMVIAHIYRAIESSPGAADWRQCLWACNASTITASTRRIALKADSWSDTSVSIAASKVPAWATHLIVEKADGTEVAQTVS